MFDFVPLSVNIWIDTHTFFDRITAMWFVAAISGALSALIYIGICKLVDKVTDRMYR